MLCINACIHKRVVGRIVRSRIFRPFRAQSLPPVVECSAADNALGYHTYRYVFNILCIILYCGLLSRIATTTMAHHHIIVLYSPTVRTHAPSANTVQSITT